MQSAFRAVWLSSLAALLLLPAALMSVRWVRPRLMPWRAIVGILMFGGWLLVNVGVHSYNAYLHDIVVSMPDPDLEDPFVRKWVADGGMNVFAAVFGWLYAPILWLLWSPIFTVAWGTRWLVRQRRRSPRASVTGWRWRREGLDDGLNTMLPCDGASRSSRCSCSSARS